MCKKAGIFVQCAQPLLPSPALKEENYQYAIINKDQCSRHRFLREQLSQLEPKRTSAPEERKLSKNFLTFGQLIHHSPL